MQNKILRLDSKDNVLIALADLNQGEHVGWEGTSCILASNIPAKHEFATDNLAIGADVIMDGVLVGKAVRSIRQGEALTTRNVQHAAAIFHEHAGEYQWPAPDTSRWKQQTFLGHPRSDGQVGTRNFWLVVPLVFCENRNIGVLKQAFEEELGFAASQVYRRQVAELAKLYRDGVLEGSKIRSLSETGADPPPVRTFENVDGIKFLLPEGGCG